MERLMIYCIFIIALLGGLIEAIGVPGYYSIATEMLIIYLFLLSPLVDKNRHGFVFHRWYIFLIMMLIAIFSMVLNHTDILSFLVSLRLIFRFYFFYLAIITLDLDDEAIKKINVFIVALLLLQLPVVAYKFHLYGINEKTMGAYAKHGGALTTMLPISFIFYLAAYYFLYQPKRRYILTAIGFVVFSILGAKRAVFFLYPIQSLAIYHYFYVKAKGVSFSKKLGALIVFFFLIGITSGSILYLNDTLNSQGRIGGSVDTGYAFEFAKNYTLHEDDYGYSTGRLLTTKRIFKGLWDLGLVNLLFGLGPGSLTPSVVYSLYNRDIILKPQIMLKFKYGVTSASRMCVEYGVLGVFTYGLLIYLCICMCIKYYRYEVDPYWKSFAAGSAGFAFSMFFFFFVYGDAAFWGDTMPALYFYAMAVVYIRLKRITLPIPRSVAHGYNYI